MIPLTLPTHKLQVVLAGAITTSQPQCAVIYYDVPRGAKSDFGTYRRFMKVIDTNSANDVDICDAPPQDVVRHIETINIYNKDTVNAVVTIKLDVGGVENIFIKNTLATTKTLIYETGAGWLVI